MSCHLNKSERWRANFKGARFQSIPALEYRNLSEAKKDVGGYLMVHYSTQRHLTLNEGIPPFTSGENLKILSGIS